ncbi:DUF1924 domain-containing protein [Aliamphritea spongicola]|uniref:DUF1924 domain-containing protein n=1 Tax=Aliamphritea spongicola TaxID=707589 RepID=UPI00196BAD07|nr:DUF1924 domain-containing protein [Aliamphritea spongicola]MBN3560814.1 DUF1924 domain-containing protein [Aliamphritea spongicola]
MMTANRLSLTFGCIGILLLSSSVFAAPADDLLSKYKGQGVNTVSAEAGKALWFNKFAGRSCTDCHGESLTEAGQHNRTAKPIAPMAPSVNALRLTDEKKIEKWFLRNCKSTLKRACSLQEKADVLAWLKEQ